MSKATEGSDFVCDQALISPGWRANRRVDPATAIVYNNEVTVFSEYQRFSVPVAMVSMAMTVASAQEASVDLVRELRVFSAAESPGSEPGAALFGKVSASESGLDFVIPIDTIHPDKRLYYSAMACGSVAAGDLDGDGWAELFFATGPTPNRLYRNRGEGAGLAFEEVTSGAGVADADSWSTGGTMVDIDNDGDLDLYVCRYDAPNRLFVNESEPGSFVFREAAKQWGLDVVDASLMPAFADYDGDGDLDLFMVANAYYRKGGRPREGIPLRSTSEGWKIVPPWDRYFEISGMDPLTGEPKYDECGRPNRLLRNEGGRFVDVSKEAGLLRTPSHTNAAVWWDYDGDGWLDLYVANDFDDRDECYRNQGDGTFVEVAAELFQHTTWFSMGAAAEDLNGDGRTDLVVADMAPTTHYREKVTMGEMGASFEAMRAAGLPRQAMVNSYFVNSGGGLFFEAARQAGIAKTDWTWTVKSGDLDSDGRIDLYFPTGHTRDFNNSDFAQAGPAQRIGKEDWDFFEDLPELREKDIAFRNAGDWHFEKSGKAWGLGQVPTMTYGAALSDLDRDGDLDMVTVGLEDSPGVFRNESAAGDGANRVLLSLRGRASNRFGIGAKVSAILPDGRRLTRTLLPNNGYQESDEPMVHLGLGGADSIDRMTIEWPSGVRQELEELAGNRWWEITEPANVEERGDSVTQEEETPPVFRRSGNFGPLALPDRFFDDFARQPLLPHQHSRLGPGQAWGDVDGDGRDDLYLGSPKGQPGRLLLNRRLDERGEPVFALRMKPPFSGMSEFEDLGVLLFEADGDGDADLLAVSGSVECAPGDQSLRDRLYLNNGVGEFTESTDGLPVLAKGDHASGSVAAAADFDRDGDLDVFIGGRVVPGQYPLAARNRLLINDGTGRFTDEAKSSGLEETGLVTSALWSDVDDDGWIDLLVTHEWGAIRLFSNRKGSLVDATEESGLAKATGMWNSIAGRDLDGDGDIDYLAGNLGENTKYHASNEAPELIFYGAFGNDGRRNIIEAKFDQTHDQLLPRRGLSCSTRAIPQLKNSVGTFHQWASSSLSQLYTDSRLAEALRFEATTLDSMLLTNDGEGRFQLTPLPPMAQLAPVFGIVLTDADGDGISDAVLAQNFLSTQEETGGYDGGLSLLLQGVRRAKEGIELVERWPRESGIAVTGDAKSLGVGDLDGDHRPDLVFGVNQGAPGVFLNSASTGIPLVIELEGGPGNPQAIGAKVTIEIPKLPKQAAEVSAGGGYLTQNSSRLFYGWGNAGEEGAKVPPELARMTIRWPEGRISTHSLARADGPLYRIKSQMEKP